MGIREGLHQRPLVFTVQRLLRPIRVGLKLCGESFADLMADKGLTYAAAIAYAVTVSIFPLLLLLIGTLGFVFRGGDTQRYVLEMAGRYLPPGALEFLQNNISAMVKARGPLSLASTVGLLWSATLMFDAINEAINAAWGIRHPERFIKSFIKSKIKSILFILLLLVFLLSSVILTTQTALFNRFGLFLLQLPGGEWLWGIGRGALPLMDRFISVALTFVALILTYLFLPRVRVSLKDVWLATLLAALLWEGLKRGFVWYVTSVANYSQVYGSISTVLVFLIWTHLSALVLIWGAEFASRYSSLRKSAVAA